MYTNGTEITLEVEEEQEIELSVTNLHKVTTNNYIDLKNKPAINGVILEGDKSSKDLGLQPAGEYVTDEEQAEALLKINQKQIEQDNSIKALENGQAAQGRKIEEFRQELIEDQTRQDNIMINFELEQAAVDKRQDTNLEDYKKAQLYKNNEQDRNIQDNALSLLEKVDEDTYIKDQLAQNEAIKGAIEAIEANRTEANQELTRLENLANSKATIDDINLSPNTTFSSYESATRLTCERTYKGARVEIEPVEGYPITATAYIEAVQQSNGNISGWNNVEIVQDNGGTHQVYNTQLDAPVFGGIFEAHKGKLTITKKSATFNGQNENWEEIALTNGRRHMFVLRNAVTNASNDTSLQLCNNYNINTAPEQPTDFAGVWIKDNNLYLGGGEAQYYETIDEWKAFLIEAPLQIVYGLVKAETELLEPKVIKATTGKNVLYSNTGDVEITTHVLPLCEGDTPKGAITGIKVNGKLVLPNDNVVDLQIITSEAVDTKIAAAVAEVGDFIKVDELPAVGKSKAIYLVPIGEPRENNGFTEHIYLKDSGTWEEIGTTNIDLSGYVKATDLVPIDDNDIAEIFGEKVVA